MNTTVKMLFALAAAVAVVVVGINLLPMTRGAGGSGAATASPVVTAFTTPSPAQQPESMSVAGSTLRFTADLPAGWERFDFGAKGQGFAPGAGIAFFVSVVDNTFSDPCRHVQRDPKLEATVEALAAGLGEIPDTTATAPVQVMLAGNEATYLELTIAPSLPCDPDEFYLWQDSPNADWWALAPQEMIRVWIIEVGGGRVAVAARSYPATSDERTPSSRKSSNSIRFDVTT